MAMRGMFVAVLVLSLCSLAHTAHAAIDEYIVSVDARESRIDYDVLVRQSGGPFVITVPKDAWLLESFVDEQRVHCARDAQNGVEVVTCPSGNGSHELRVSYATRYPLFILPDKLEYRDEVHLEREAQVLRYRMTLPSGVLTDISDLERPPTVVSVEGSRIVLEWDVKEVDSFEIELTMRRAAISFTAGIFLAVLGGVVIGILGYFTWDHRRDLIDRIRHMQHHMDVDGLTKVYNRAAFDREIGLRLSDRRTFGLAMVDIDYFKKLNDTLGHQAGDDALRKVARSLRHHTRRHDRVFRYGGEEFAVVFENVNEKSLPLALEKVRSLVKRDVGVTVSIGAAMRAQDDAAAVLIERADKALYRAKESGRDRAVVNTGNDTGDSFVEIARARE